MDGKLQPGKCQVQFLSKSHPVLWQGAAGHRLSPAGSPRERLSPGAQRGLVCADRGCSVAERPQQRLRTTRRCPWVLLNLGTFP